ncbi:MAG TPA: DUF559 domain-containing protein [Burkholderiales bacterium]|nr:DUF559 domain-containing protein [Burkholderiales bacterium]
MDRYVAYRKNLNSHFVDGSKTYDEARTAWLESQGVRVLRFTNPDVIQNFEAVCAMVLDVLSET